ncbi:hypothetical protein E4U17_003373 [Claviceps sp. LM77 group G4]|nr:hypothetical protein E4U17_003373 [Claviceps sp. LM77 group G4]KAG6075716.1 hypothetical protein E4U33_001997 [Claviceps sp. LM78 group G4]KAG6080726.1 hypothetical protein E4U16_008201 [Claviceps sp. LM84 group G4]
MASSDTADEPPSRLRQTFQDVPFSAHPQTWSALYQDGYHPWDRLGPSLALADLLAQRPDLVPPAQEHDHRGNLLRDSTGQVVRRTALVPGCGPGHDVLLLSSFGYDVVGLDCCTEAVRMAEENHKKMDERGIYEPLNGVERGQVRWVEGDFFGDAWTKGLGNNGEGQFDLIFDYTFLCALPLSARPNWSSRMAELLHPSGRLVCLEFPSGKPLSLGGPPWGLTPEVYEALLGAPGSPITYQDDDSGRVLETVPAKPHPQALHRLSLIKPARTHESGEKEDVTVRHLISVWSR